MPGWVIIAFFLIALVVVVTLVLSASIVLVSPITRGAMFHPSARIRVRTFVDKVPMSAGELLVDVGCGDGRVLRQARKRYGVRGLGFEVNPLIVVIAKLSVLGRRGISIRWTNFWKVNLAGADILFCYLFPDVMERLAAKLERELRPGTRVVSCNFPFPRWVHQEVLSPDSSLHGDPIFVYRFPECLPSRRSE